MKYESKYDYLEHHGIKGQKWGRRNYQNEDGTLTAAGKARYGVGNGSSTGKNNKKADPDAEARREKRKNALKKAGKVALGIGAAAAIGYGAHKSTKLRDEMRKEAKYLASDARNVGRNATRQQAVIDSKMWDARHDHTVYGDLNARAERLSHEIIKSELLEEKYTKIALTGTRRDAVRNYMKHKGHIYVGTPIF